MRQLYALILLFFGILSCPTSLQAQIDPVPRQLIQLGYDRSLEGKSPLSGYAFYYWNRPAFYHSNLTLRLALAPVYVDSELGISQALGPHTDVGIGLAGGGFADTYSEMRRGKYIQKESFTGHGAEISASLYHLFNPGRLIPLHAVFRGSFHHSMYSEDSRTDDAFKIPDDQGVASFRAGLRWGGMEPLMTPEKAMEISAWYEVEFRGDDERYGFNDRTLEEMSQLFWMRALLAYTIPEKLHYFNVSLTAGTSIDSDRMSSYRLGGWLPLASEFPLTLPGYFYQELSARNFALLHGTYQIPVGQQKRWSFLASGSSGVVDYIKDLEQPGNWHSSLGGGIGYRNKTGSWMGTLGYAYGFDAIRNSERGAHSVGIWMQFDLERTTGTSFQPGVAPERSRGLNRLFRGI